MTSDMYRDGQYLEQNPDWHAGDSAWKAEKILAMLGRCQVHPNTIGEVGCGAGGVLRALQERMDDDCRFSGMDVSPQAIELASKSANDHLSFECKNVTQDETLHWDLLMLIDVFEHVPDYLGLLRSVKGRATYKLFHIPLDLSVQTVLRAKPIAKNHETVGHIHYFTKETALQALKDAGYTILDHEFTGTAIDLPAKSVLSACLRWPRKLCFAVHPDLTARVLGGFSLLVLAQ